MVIDVVVAEFVAVLIVMHILNCYFYCCYCLLSVLLRNDLLPYTL